MEIECDEPTTSRPERTFWISDLSTNGTWVNGNRIEKGTRIQLKDGDEILIVNDDLPDGSRANFGFRFTIFNEQNAPPLISEPPAQFIQEFKHRVKTFNFVKNNKHNKGKRRY